MKIILATIKSIGCWHYQHCLTTSTNFVDKIPGVIVILKWKYQSKDTTFCLGFLLHHSNTSSGIYAMKMVALSVLLSLIGAT